MNKLNSKYYLLSICTFMLFHVPIITVYFNSVLDSITLVSILFTVKSITTAALEIPTGYIADRCSRKLSLLLGIVFNISSLVLFSVNPNFCTLLIGEVCFGIGECLTSGADSAFFYDNFTAEGRNDDYNSFAKNLGLIQSVFLSISFFIGSIIYKSNNKIPFIATIVFQVIAMIVLLLIKEHPYKKNTGKKNNIKDDIKIFMENKDKDIAFILVVYSLVLGMFICLYLQLFPIITYNLTGDSCLYGILYVVVMMVLGIGSKCSSDDIRTLPKFLLVLFMTMCIGIIINNNIYILIAILITRFMWGYISTGLSIYLNDNISNSNYRATIFSVLSITTNLFSSVFMFVVGFVMDNNIDLKYLFVICSLIILIIFVLSKKFVSLKGGEKNELQSTNM